MISKTRPPSKPCSCRDGIPCVGCKRKRGIKPSVYLEEPRPLTVPIVISRYKHKKPVTVNRATTDRTIFRKQANQPKTGTTLCRWFRRRKAFRELKAEHERERERVKIDPAFRAQKEKEYELFQELFKKQAEQYQQEKERKIIADVLKETQNKRKPVKEKLTKPKKEAKPKKEKYKTKHEDYSGRITLDPVIIHKQARRFSVKSASCRPRATSRCVSVKKYNHHTTLTERFVNCFYRFCCQLYCYATVLLIIGVAVIMLL